ncbi:MAG: hypothetical protein AAGD38_07310 [Acidobacteriota bacterium]
MIMPITTPELTIPRYQGDVNHFLHVYEHLFAPAITAAGYKPIPPATEGVDVIQARIIQELETADLVLCDMSCLNANVFFELGIRTALDRPACIVIDDATPDPPFDVVALNHYRYRSRLSPWDLDAEIEQLASHVAHTKTPNNALWQVFGLTQRAHRRLKKTGNERDQLDYIELILKRLSHELDRENSQWPTTIRDLLVIERPDRPAAHKRKIYSLTIPRLRGNSLRETGLFLIDLMEVISGKKHLFNLKPNSAIILPMTTTEARRLDDTLGLALVSKELLDDDGKREFELSRDFALRSLYGELKILKTGDRFEQVLTKRRVI